MICTHLPDTANPFLAGWTPLQVKHLRVENAQTGAVIVGESANANAGRGLDRSYDTVLIMCRDESAYGST